jgi:hypothetical protein
MLIAINTYIKSFYQAENSFNLIEETFVKIWRHADSQKRHAAAAQNCATHIYLSFLKTILL